MNWNTIYTFLQLDGYGPYLWGSYAVMFGALVVESLLARRRHARALAALRDAGILP